MSLSICADKPGSMVFQELQLNSFRPSTASISIPTLNLENPGQTRKRKKETFREVFEPDIQRTFPTKSVIERSFFPDILSSKRTLIESDPASALLARNLRIYPEPDSEYQVDYVLKIGKILFAIRNSFQEYQKYGSPNENRFVSRSETGLERSLQVDADGTIWILLNREKDGDLVLGTGSFKKVTRAVNVWTSKVCARAVFYNISDAEQEIRVAKLCGARVEGVVKTYSSISSYTNKKGEIKASLILEQYDFETLEDRLDSSLTRLSKIRIAEDVLTGLKNLHNLKVCHLDIKPNNILTYQDELGTRAVLADLNLSSEIGALVDSRGEEEYRPPEMLEIASDATIPATPAMDIFSLGSTFEELIDFPTILSEKTLKQMVDKDPKKRPSAQDLLDQFAHERRAQILRSAVKSSIKWKTTQIASSKNDIS